MDVHFDRHDLRAIVRETVGQVLAEIEARRPDLDGRLVYSEPEAADLLGLKHHQLRDLRLAGKIEHCRVVGKRIRYSREQLLGYLAGCEEGGQ